MGLLFLSNYNEGEKVCLEENLQEQEELAQLDKINHVEQILVEALVKHVTVTMRLAVQDARMSLILIVKIVGRLID